jgi:translation initiation factor IF-2
MAKKKPTSRTDAVRQAVDQAFQTQIPRERISELLDELGNTAGRLRGAVDDLRPASAEDVKTLRADLQALTTRVTALEAEVKAKPEPPKPKPKPAPRKPAAAKPAAAKPKPAAAAAASSASSATAAPKPRKSAAAKPKPKPPTDA